MKKFCFVFSFLLLLSLSSYAQTAEVTRSGNTWTASVGNSTVYTGNNMTEAVNAAANGMTGGTINVRNSGVADVFWGMQPRANQTLDFHGNTIESADNVIPIYADRRNGITVRNVHMTGGPRYGIWFRGCSDVHFHNITMELSHAPEVGLGIRVDNHSDHGVATSNLRATGVIRIEGSRGHGFETYSINGVEIERVITRNTGGCGLILNDTRNAEIGYVNAYRADYGGGYAGFRTPNNSGPNVVLDTLIATECGRGFFSLTGTDGVTINYVEITGSTNIGIWIENVPNNRVLSGYVWNNNNHVSISGSNVGGSSVNVQNTAPPSTPPPQCDPTAIVAHVRVNLGDWQESNSAELEVGGTVEFGPHPATGGLWSWSGPNSFSADTREVTISNIQSNQAGTYTATYTNDCGTESTQDFAVTVNAPPPITEIEIGSGNLIENLTVFEVENGDNWSIVDNIEVGQTVFGDREFTIASIPNFTGSVEWIQTAMNSRTNTSLDNYATFTAKETGFVYIAHSSRVEDKPAWLSDYELTDLVITVQESAEVVRTLNLYRKSVSAGETINVGINSDDGITTSLMYIVIITDSTTSVKQVANIEDVALSVFPNPFNPVANINFTVANSSDVELNVFNINGELVSSLASGVFEKGHYTASFDGKTLSSGVYFVRFSSGNKMLQKKMILLK